MELEKHYNGFKGREISWILSQFQSQEHGKYIDERFKLYRDEFRKEIKDMRKSKMYAFKFLFFELFCDFMTAHKFMTKEDRESMLSEFKREIIERGRGAAQDLENFEPANVFLDCIKALKASGYIVFGTSITGVGLASGTIAWLDEEENVIYVHPTMSVNAIKKSYNPTFNPDLRGLGATFKAKKWLAKTNNGFYFKKKIDGVAVSLWAFKGEIFGVGEGKTLDYVAKVSTFLFTAISELKITSQPAYTQHQDIIKRTVKLMGGRYGEKATEEVKKILEYESFLTENIIPPFYVSRGWTVPKNITMEDFLKEQQQGENQNQKSSSYSN